MCGKEGWGDVALSGQSVLIWRRERAEKSHGSVIVRWHSEAQRHINGVSCVYMGVFERVDTWCIFVAHWRIILVYIRLLRRPASC